MSIKTQKLSEFFGVPVTRTLKKRVVAMARRLPGEPTPTKLARIYLERGVEADEKALGPSPQTPAPEPSNA